MITQTDITTREHVLIAAAVAAVVGSRFHVLEIRAAEEKPGTEWERRSRTVQHIRIPIQMRPRQKEEPIETPDYA